MGGLHTQPAVIHYDGAMHGVQVDLTPAGARSLLGLPAGDLGPLVVRLEDLLGSDVDELIERMVIAPGWPARFDLLNNVLGRRAGQIAPTEAPLTHAWDHIVKAAGDIRVSQVAAEVGWSRRQLGERFTREYGLTVKEACRVLRFHRSRLLIQHQPGITIAAAAATCGYYDQAHLAREWRELAGCPPSTWLSTEELPFIQDAGEKDGAD
ncbi:MAG: helix-turn-helix domain-containing protein [Chloroflexota bacterium]|nr:helix-turn-helix domain-containing protein [Chloroflexota bacterium]